jgi:hypothetical protein
MRLAVILVAVIALDTTASAECSALRKRAQALRDTLAAVGETTPEYRSMMVKRIQDADNAASTCERAAADAKRVDETNVAARKREMEVEAKKAADDRFVVDGLRSQPMFLRVAWSAFNCSYEKQRDTLLNNPFATAEQKEELKRVEFMLKRIRATMNYGKLEPVSCRTEDVAKLAFCISESGANAACGESEMALRSRAEHEIIAAVQLTPNPAPLTPAEPQAKSESDDMRLLQPRF